jgi:hypothetical protein|nr:MAG TPA: hypothetical protein [Caudoviricetes sp.]
MSELTHVKANVNGVECELVNMTPHPITVFDVDGNQPIVTVPSSGMVRVAETVRTVSEGEGQVPLVQIVRDPDKIEGLPAWAIGRYVIVSDLAYQAAKTLGREDLLRPGPAVRDENGRIIGCKGLAI